MTTSPIPAARDDDPEDVSWALSTAATQWARGDRIEALKWLRRAAEAASEAEKDSRALELAKAAADLSTPSMPPPSRPPPAMTPKAPPATPSSRPISVAPKPAPATKPPQPTAKATPQAKKTSTKPPAAGKSAADETSKRGAVKAKPEMRPRAPLPDEKTDTHVMTEVTRLDAKPPVHDSRTDAESWPTESMGAEELDKLHENEQVYGTERTRIGQPAYRPSDPPPGQTVEFKASQAVHVIVWRDGDGRLRVAPRGTTVSAVTIEALLVAPSPDVDLLAWLSPT